MNKNVIIASTLAAGAAALFYYLRKSVKNYKQHLPVPVQPTRHLTSAFAKAKKHSLPHTPNDIQGS